MPQPADDERVRAWVSEHPQVRYVDLLLPDQMGIPRGKRVTIEELETIVRDGLLLPASMFALDVLGGTVQSTGLGFDDGDADRICLPIAGSLAPVPWLGPEVAQMQVSMYEHDRRPFHGDPRHVLAGVLRHFGDLGLTPVMAVELEFYLVDRERTAEGHAQPPRQPLSGRREFRTQINSMADLNEYSTLLAAHRRRSARAGAARGHGARRVRTRTVRGQPASRPRRAHRLRSRDPAQAAGAGRCPAARHGSDLHAQALPRPCRQRRAPAREPGRLRRAATCLRRRTPREARCSVTRSAVSPRPSMRRWRCARPTANSYRRFRPEAYVPLNPSWAINNRGVAFRIPHGPPASRRVEHRVAGADANPYLLAGVVLAGMHHGLTQTARSRRRRSRATPTATGAQRFRSPGRRPSPRSSAASSCADYLGDAFTRSVRGHATRRDAGVQLAHTGARLRLVPDDELSGHA